MCYMCIRRKKMKWKPPANASVIKGYRLLTRHKQETRQRQQRTQNVVSSSAPVAPTFTILKFGLGWDHETEGLYEDPSTLKYIHDDDDELLVALGAGIDDDVDLRNTQFTDNQGKKVDFPDAYNQGQLGSCTANALAFCYQFDMLNEVISFGPGKTSIPSRLFIYYYERASENTINFDNGAKLSDGIKNVLDIKGVCSETDWPYYDKTNGNETYKIQPNSNAIENAKNHKIISQTDAFIALHNTVENLKNNLQRGSPIAFGFKVYQSFYNISEGNPTMPIPSPSQGDKLIGGHAVVLVGFKEKEKVFIVRNSWGKGWGDNGYFFMPYDFIEAVYTDPKDNKVKPYVSDFWSIIEVS